MFFLGAGVSSRSMLEFSDEIGFQESGGRMINLGFAGLMLGKGKTYTPKWW